MNRSSLLGLSFGGLIACELAKILSPDTSCNSYFIHTPIKTASRLSERLYVFRLIGAIELFIIDYTSFFNGTTNEFSLLASNGDW